MDLDTGYKAAHFPEQGIHRSQQIRPRPAGLRQGRTAPSLVPISWQTHTWEEGDFRSRVVGRRERKGRGSGGGEIFIYRSIHGGKYFSPFLAVGEHSPLG